MNLTVSFSVFVYWSVIDLLVSSTPENMIRPAVVETDLRPPSLMLSALSTKPWGNYSRQDTLIELSFGKHTWYSFQPLIRQIACSRPSALSTCCQLIACLLFHLEPAAGLFCCTFRTQVVCNKLSSNYPIPNYSLYLITEIIRKRTIQCKHKLHTHLNYWRLQNTLREIYIYIYIYIYTHTYIFPMTDIIHSWIIYKSVIAICI